MSGISSVNSTSSTSNQGTLGDSQGPISFPGIASGIDYNAIIQKLTSLTTAQNVPLQAEATQLSKANTELIKINGLIGQVQNAITALADPTLFSAFSATSSNTAVATAAQTAGGNPTAGTTTILSQTLATSTQITSDPAANKPVNTAVTLATAGFQITPSNGGTSGSGKFTVNGTTITYDVATDTVQTILNKLNAIPGVTATFTGDQITLSSATPISIGSANDKGNLAQVFKLDVAQITAGQKVTSGLGGLTAATTFGSQGIGAGTVTIDGQAFAYTAATTFGAFINSVNATVGSAQPLQANLVGGNLVITSEKTPITFVPADTGNFTATAAFGAAAATQSATSAATVGGLNPGVPLSTANLTTALNGGNVFTINGTAISITPATQSLNDVINAINSSNAGVIATWNTTAGQLQLVAKATGPQSIVLGAPGDNSNFLTAVGLTTAGATTLVGTQASVTYQTPAGGTATVFSNTNSVTNVIPGVTLSLLQSTATPYTVTVAQDSTSLVKNIGNFVTAYNAAIDEINTATAPPVVQTAGKGTPISPGTPASSQVVPGGVLFDNSSVQALKDRLVSLVSSLVQNNSTSYNSFASVGLLLDTSVAVVTSGSTSGNSNTSNTSNTNNPNGLQTQIFDGTSGKLQALNTTTFNAAFAANPKVVSTIFTGAQSISASLGAYLTYVTGAPTQLGPSGSFVGNIPDVSLIQGIENSNSSQIDSINQQISLINTIATQQANNLRAQFLASENLIAQLQREQASLSSLIGTTNSTGH